MTSDEHHMTCYRVSFSHITSALLYTTGLVPTKECWTPSLNEQHVKKMGYSSRRPHWVPLLSANHRKLRLQFTQAHQNWTIEDWKSGNCVMLPCQYGSKSLRNVSNTLLKVWHEELRQFWRQKRVQPFIFYTSINGSITHNVTYTTS